MMKRIWMVAGWTLAESFRSATVWVSVAGFTLLNGLVLTMMLWESSNPQLVGQGIELHRSLLPTYFSTMALLLLLICPTLAMNSISGEKSSHRWTLLQTSILSNLELVLGKVIGLWMLLMILLGSTLPLLGILGFISTPIWWRWLLGYWGIWLLGLLYMTIGVWTSGRTQTPIRSWLLSVTICLLLWFIGTINSIPLLQLLSPLPKLQEFLDGWWGLWDNAYFLAFCAFLIYHTQDRFESERWSTPRPLEQRITPYMWLIVMVLSLTVIARLDRYWDWNPLRTTLSAEGLSMIEAMPDLEIVVDLPPTDSRFKRFQTLIRNWPSTQTSNIQWLNQSTRPPSQPHGVYLTYQQTTVALTEAISPTTVEQGLRDVLYPTTPSLCFTQSGGEPSIVEGVEDTGLALLSEYLLTEGFDIQSIGVETDLNNRETTCNLVIIAGRTAPISTQWLDQNLQDTPSIILLDPTTTPIPKSWLATYGVAIEDDFLLEPNPQFQIFGDPTTLKLSQHSLLSHPKITLHNQSLLLNSLRSIRRIPDHTEHLTVELLRASPQSWAETDYTSDTPSPNNDDLIGNVPLLVEVNSLPTTGTESPTPRLMVLGSSSLIHNKWVLQNPYNATFFIDMIKYLLQENRPSLSEPSDVYVQVSTAEVQRIGFFAVVGFPGFILLLGWRKQQM